MKEVIDSLKFLILIILIISCQNDKKQIEYPQVKREVVVDTLANGQKISDPYRWLEDLESQEVKNFAIRQDSLFNNYVNENTNYKVLEKEIASYAAYERYVFPRALILPFETPSGIYYTVKAKESEHNEVYLRKSPDSEQEKIIDATDNPADHTLTSYHVDKQGRYLSVGYSLPTSNWTFLRLKDLRTNEFLTDSLSGIYGAINLTWKVDGSGFYYTRYEQPEDLTDPNFKIGGAQIYYHRVGTSQKSDKFIYALNRTRASIQLFSNDSKLLVRSGETSIVDIQTKEASPFNIDSDYPYKFLKVRGDTLYYLTTEGTSSGCRVVSMRWDAPSDMNIVIDQVDIDISNPALMQGKYLLAHVSRDAKQILKVFDIETGSFLHELKQPFVGTIYKIEGGASNSSHVYFSLINLTNPLTILRADLSNGSSGYFLKPKLTIDQDNFVTKRVFYESKDGTGVPLLVSYKNDIKLDGNTPTILYAYGALASPTVDYYQEEMIAWLNNGGIYANAGIRGGGDYGSEWIASGRGINKQNAIDDYIYAGKWLIENNYTSSKKLIAYGGSLSGVLPAAGIMQESGLFGAAMIRIPVIDMVRFPEFGSARNWKNEFGDPENPDELAAILAYSPYHNLDSMVSYPPTIVQVGEKDQTATPIHGYKLAAALQYANRESENPVLLQVGWEAGHAIGKDRTSSDEAKAKALAFLLNNIK